MNLDELEKWAEGHEDEILQAFQLLARIARDQQAEIQALHKRVEQLETQAATRGEYRKGW